MPALKKIGAAALSAFGFGGGAAAVTANYLIVAGGAGGGTWTTSGNTSGGGGGAGGYQANTTTLTTTLSYTITVGAGGASATNGSNSSFGVLTASVGGGAGGSAAVGSSGGSGGGGGTSTTTSIAGGSGTSGQGSAGGTGTTDNATYRQGGGGGGAGAVGSNGAASSGGAGGTGNASSITGTSVTYAGGGGGGGTVVGAGGSGGGGAGGSGSNGTSGAANTGGGGGGSAHVSPYTAGLGGSGIVIISYAGAQQFGGGVVSSAAGNTIHTFYTSGTLSPLASLSASYLIVAGGAGGQGGGGGAGGLLSGSGTTIDTNSTYLVTVGAGGSGGVTQTSGSNSLFSIVSTSAVGGGKGANFGTDGTSGGSGGGAASAYAISYTGGAGTSGQGNAGGNSSTGHSAGGGGGVAGAVGSNTSLNTGGNGGNGSASSISGSSVTYAGGGGGGGAGASGSGGTGGGGAGGSSPVSGTANTGGGGGGSYTTYGAAGGSGIVIISYAGSTQQMSGGTVTVSGGNVIHTFTSSGYLSPLTNFSNSLRFRSSASAYLNRTPTVASNRKTWTWSSWVKLGNFGSATTIFSCGSSGSNLSTGAQFLGGTNEFQVYDYTTGYNFNLTTTQLFRDPAAWYHIVIAFDTTQATAANRVKLYVNGTQVTAFSTATYPTQNTDYQVNNTVPQYIGRFSQSGAVYLDGYQTNINFIDGQQLTPNSFGSFNQYGNWVPVTYGGSYGTNGFYLPFTNTTSTTTLGYDFSPAGNNWTTNNISLTSGSTYDSMTDVPTLTSATAANYCVMNPLKVFTGGTDNLTLSNGNLTATDSSTSVRTSTATMSFPSTGKFYFECYMASVGATQSNMVGVIDSSQYNGNGPFEFYGAYRSTGAIYNLAQTAQTSGATYTTGDWIGIAVDVTNGTVQFYKNNVAQGATPSFTFTAGTQLWAYVATDNTTGTKTYNLNFGQQPFTYTPPSGFVALNAYNM